MEKIISIEEAYNFDEQYDGFKITTDKQEIYLGIYNYQSCCEDWGYLMSEDDLTEYIGANLLSIKKVDTASNTKVLERLEESYEPDTVFVNLETSKGTLQFVAYNSHNGYYGHEVVIRSNQLTDETYI